MTVTGEHWGPVEAAWPTPEDELESSELGERVAWAFLNWELISIYSLQADRERSAVSALVAQVAEVTSWRGLPFPSEWWPPDLPPLEN